MKNPHLYGVEVIQTIVVGPGVCLDDAIDYVIGLASDSPEVQYALRFNGVFLSIRHDSKASDIRAQYWA